MADDSFLLDHADDILDARPLDWTSAAARASDEQRALLGPLRAVAEITSFHLTQSIASQTARQEDEP